MKASAKGDYMGQLTYILRVFAGHNQEFAVNNIVRCYSSGIAICDL